MGCTTSLAIVSKNSVALKKDEEIMFDRFRQPDIVISQEEKVLIKRQWKVLSADMKATGAAVFMKIFRAYPEIKQQFPYGDTDTNNLPMNSELRGHAFRFMQAVGATVENIDELDSSMSEALMTLGKQHVKFTGFKPYYIQAFYDAILEVWREVLGVYYTPACADAWSHLLLFMMEKLKKGYHLASLEATTLADA